MEFFNQKRVTSLLALVLVSQSCSTPSSTRSPSSDQPESKFDVVINGGDESSFYPPITGTPVRDEGEFDVIIVGGGLAGLTSAVYLGERGKSVFLLEKEKHFGGLASGTRTENGTRYDRGAAYWTDAYEEELEILKHIGLGDFKEKDAIAEPIDSYLWNGKLYEGIWEDETLKELPASFEVFKHELVKGNEAGLFPNQPIEESKKLQLDAISAETWIKRMPAKLSKRKDEESLKIYARFKSEVASGRIKAKDPMRDVIDMLDLYCRSALGTRANGVSAVAFGNFYISEIETRFTTPIGTGRAAKNMEKILRDLPNVVLSKLTPVGKIVPRKNSVDVYYNKNGDTRIAKAKFVIFAGQIKLAPKMIEGFERDSPEQAHLMSDLGYSHYSVHVAQIKGHPYRATYDTWTRGADYTEEDFTDVILGRWMDPAIKGYEGMRDFSKNPSDDHGIMTIYHPLPPSWLGTGYTDEQVIRQAKSSVQRMLQIYNPLLKEKWGTQIEVQKVEANRWPYSVHIAAPGHFTGRAKILRKPYGRIFFAHSNIGTPAFEEALFRGHCAANNVLTKMSKVFVQESWTNCPIDTLENKKP
ncbi:MAG: FAD-dependent oxidoreductase [Bdellovibrionota bacterium]